MSAFINFSEQELQQLYGELKAEFLASVRGQRYVSLSTGGKSFTRRVRSSADIKADMGDCELALRNANPTVYGDPLNKTYAAFGSYVFK